MWIHLHSVSPLPFQQSIRYIAFFYIHYCQTAFQLQLGLLRHLHNFITNRTWRASWHYHEVGMKCENDYRDLSLYYSDFLIIASLIYFCFLYFFLPLSLFLFYPFSTGHAEVEQKGKPANIYTHIQACLCSQPRLRCNYFAHYSRKTFLLKSLLNVCM